MSMIQRKEKSLACSYNMFSFPEESCLVRVAFGRCLYGSHVVHAHMCCRVGLSLTAAANTQWVRDDGRTRTPSPFKASFSSANSEEKHCIIILVAFCLYLVKII
jgi:hypothetical protein